MRQYFFARKICFQCNMKVFEKPDKLVFSHARFPNRSLAATDFLKK